MEECDFCGNEFPSALVDTEMQEHDYCVCPDCVDIAREQLIAMGDIEEETEDLDDW